MDVMYDMREKLQHFEQHLVEVKKPGFIEMDIVYTKVKEFVGAVADTVKENCLVMQLTKTSTVQLEEQEKLQFKRFLILRSL